MIDDLTQLFHKICWRFMDGVLATLRFAILIAIVLGVVGLMVFIDSIFAHCC